jgi:hypothetical protein
VVNSRTAPGPGRTSGSPVSAPGRGRRILRLLAIALVFVAIGPLVGAAIALKGFLAAGGTTFVSTDWGSAAFLLIGISTLGYVFGAFPALVAGLAVGLKRVYFGGAGWRFALAVGVTVGVAFELFFRATTGSPSYPDVVLGTYCAVVTVASLACWTIVRFADREAAR